MSQETSQQTLSEQFTQTSTTVEKTEFENRGFDKKNAYEKLYCCLFVKNLNHSCGLLFSSLYYTLIVVSYFVFIITMGVGMFSPNNNLFNPICIASLSMFSFSMILILIQRLNFFRFVSINNINGPYDSASVWAKVFFSVNCVFTFVALMVHIGTENDNREPNTNVLRGCLLSIITLSIGNLLLYLFFFIFPRYTNIFNPTFVRKNDGSFIDRFRHNYLNDDVSTYAQSILFVGFGYNLLFDIFIAFKHNSSTTMVYICVGLFSTLTIVSYLYFAIFTIVYSIQTAQKLSFSEWSSHDVYENEGISAAVTVPFIFYIFMGGIFKTLFYFFDSSTYIGDKNSLSYTIHINYLLVSMILTFIFAGVFLIYMLLSCIMMYGNCYKLSCISCCKKCKDKAIDAKKNTDNEMSGYEKNVTNV